jgi:hypothetical protein
MERVELTGQTMLFYRRCDMIDGLLKEIAAHGDRGAVVPVRLSPIFPVRNPLGIRHGEWIYVKNAEPV